jgi:hypothetical protein
LIGKTKRQVCKCGIQKHLPRADCVPKPGH